MAVPSGSFVVIYHYFDFNLHLDPHFVSNPYTDSRFSASLKDCKKKMVKARPDMHTV